MEVRCFYASLQIVMNEIHTQRLSLKLITADDFHFIQRLVNSDGWLHFIGDRNVHSPESALVYIQKILATENFYYWVIREKSSDVPVGIISFIKRDYLPHYDVGFALLPEFYGRGYASEAAKEIINVYKKLGHETILATVMPTNAKSIQLLAKLGFTLERDLVVDQERLLLFKLGA